jgi:hypothetical protein
MQFIDTSESMGMIKQTANNEFREETEKLTKKLIADHDVIPIEKIKPWNIVNYNWIGCR